MRENQQKISEISSLDSTENIDSHSCNKIRCMLEITGITVCIGGFLLVPLI